MTEGMDSLEEARGWLHQAAEAAREDSLTTAELSVELATDALAAARAQWWAEMPPAEKARRKALCERYGWVLDNNGNISPAPGTYWAQVESGDR